MARLDRSTTGLLLVLLLTRLAAMACFAVFDDAFITYRYARNLVEGLGYVYNPGAPVLGTTAPLFGLLCALLIRAGGRPELLVPLLNIAIDLGIVLLVRHLVFRNNRLGFALFVAAFVLPPILARTTVGGMEVNLFLLATIASFALFSAERIYLASALAAASYFIRPEGVLTVAIFCLVEALSRGSRRRAVAMAGVALAVVTPVLLVLYGVYGQIVPQSVIAKGRLHDPLGEVLGGLLLPEPIAAVTAILGLAGVIAAVRAGASRRLVGLWLLGYLAAYALGRPHTWSWYSFAPLTMAGIVAATTLAPRIARRWPRATAWATPIVAAVCLTFWAGLGWLRHSRAIETNIYDKVDAFCRTEVHRGDTILASDIGVIGYRCPTFIYDTAGLVWPEAEHYDTPWDAIRALKPTYLFLNASRSTRAQMASGVLAETYVPVVRFAEDGDPSPAAQRNPGDGWTQEYVMYRRADHIPARPDQPPPGP